MARPGLIRSLSSGGTAWPSSTASLSSRSSGTASIVLSFAEYAMSGTDECCSARPGALSGWSGTARAKCSSDGRSQHPTP
eukprot:3409708-Rhodomonas_salina.5